MFFNIFLFKKDLWHIDFLLEILHTKVKNSRYKAWFSYKYLEFNFEHVVECPVSSLYTCAENDWSCPLYVVIFDGNIYFQFLFKAISLLNFLFIFIFGSLSTHFYGLILNLGIKPQYCMYNIWRSRLTLGNLCDMCFFEEFSKTYPNAYVSNNSRVHEKM